MLSFWCAACTHLGDDNGYLVLLADVLLQQHEYSCVSMLHGLVEAFITAKVYFYCALYLQHTST